MTGKEPESLLKDVFGYSEFRPLQQDIINNILAKRDTLAIMPTGGGKSLCYQIPALIFDGLTVVVSPLISLMKDQVEQLHALGVAAAHLNSSLPPEAYERNFRAVAEGKAKLLYLAPEALRLPKIQGLIAAANVECMTIDEAHCISEWGHDFRPEYRKLVEVRKRFPDAVCVALTATATPRVREDIRACLEFQTSNEFIASFDRPNLFLRIVPKTNPVLQTIEFLREHQDRSGIIYCFSRRQVEDLYEVLADEGFSVRPYHAGLSDWDRKTNQELFIRDDVQIMVATVAFGMGINKPNVRFVLHYDLPKNIESYYQEIGRAGRDGLRSECLLLFSYGDMQKIKYFIDQKDEKERRIALHHLDALVAIAEADGCRRVPVLKYFGEDYGKENCGCCDNCLAGPRDVQEITVPAQMFLSCVKRTGERFGANHVINVLRGSSAARVFQLGHQHLSTYGIGKEYSLRQWQHIARQLLQKELLQKDIEFGGLSLTERAFPVLAGREKVVGRIEEEAAGKVAVNVPVEHDEELFQILRTRRKKLADTENVPPYVVFPDRTLVEMASYFPQSQSSLLQIHGVGQVKMKHYGARFLDDIVSYCKRRQIQDKLAGRNSMRRGSCSTSKKASHVAVAEAFNAGKSVAEIAADRSILETTVLSSLYKCLQEKRPLQREHAAQLLGLCQCERPLQIRTVEAFKEIGADYLRPVHDALNDEVGYPDLKVLRLYFLIKSAYRDDSPAREKGREAG